MEKSKEKNWFEFHCIFDKKVPVIVKIFWIFAYTLSITALYFQTRGVYTKYFWRPDIAQSEKLISAIEVPAPALTICPPLILKSGYANYTDLTMRERDLNSKNSINLTIKEQNFMAAMMQACTPDVARQLLKITENRTERDVVKLLKEASFDIDDIFLHCEYKEMKYDCKNFLNRVLTDGGYCFTFNMQGFHTVFNGNAISNDFDSYKRRKIVKSLEDKKEERIDDTEKFTESWSLENGYITDYDTIPYRAIPAMDVRFIVKLNISQTNEMCITRREGFKIFYHLPNEIPTAFHSHDFIDLSFKCIHTISTVKYKANSMLMSYSHDIRKCYFSKERKLSFFKTYTKAHCDLECLTNFTLRECGCVKFSMPRSEFTPVCDLDKVECYLNAFSRWPKYDSEANKTLMPCDCYPPCIDIKYNVKQKTTSILSAQTSNTIRRLQNEADGKVFAYLQLRFNDFQISEVESFVTYQLQNLVADVGGLLGLFMGISLISILSTILKFLVNIFGICKKKKFRKNQVKNNELFFIEREYPKWLQTRYQKTSQ